MSFFSSNNYTKIAENFSCIVLHTPITCYKSWVCRTSLQTENTKYDWHLLSMWHFKKIHNAEKESCNVANNWRNIKIDHVNRWLPWLHILLLAVCTSTTGLEVWPQFVSEIHQKHYIIHWRRKLLYVKNNWRNWSYQ